MWFYHAGVHPNNAVGNLNNVNWVCTVSSDLSFPIFEPAHEIMVLITYATSKGSGEPSQFTHMKCGRIRKIRPKIRHLAPLDGCACAFEECVYGGQKVP